MKYADIVGSWNKQADEYNQWDNLGEDEKCEWSAFCNFSNVAKWLAAVNPQIHEMYLQEFEEFKR